MSNARDVARASKALTAAVEAQHAAEAKLASESKRLDLRIKELQAELWRVTEAAREDRLMRISAQRGLVNYMREHGLADKIGYDPDTDPEIIAAIQRGELPKRGLALKPLIEAVA